MQFALTAKPSGSIIIKTIFINANVVGVLIMENRVKEIKIVDIDSIIPNPKNPNTHSKEQIERLCKLIKNTGFRSPLIVSNQSGFLVVGHGRLEAAKVLKMKELPVIFQDFKNEADEYAFLTADNAIGAWSELDLLKINDEVLKLENLDIEMLGIKSFSIEEEKQEEEKETEIKFEYKIEVDCITEDQQSYLTGELNDRGFKVRVLI